MKKIKYFTASWCGPCRSFKPVIQELIEEGNDIEIIDIDQNSSKATEYQIQSIPTLVFEKNGQTYHRSSGVIQKSDIKDILSNA